MTANSVQEQTWKCLSKEESSVNRVLLHATHHVTRLFSSETNATNMAGMASGKNS